MSINTRILSHEFDYYAPASLAEALGLLAQLGPEVQVIAGGTDVVPKMKLGQMAPPALLSLHKVAELAFIADGDPWRIGAASKLRAVERFCAASPAHACLHDALSSIGKIQVLNMGTLAGNLCTASPAADSAPALLSLDASVTLASQAGGRTLALDDFLLGPGRTAKQPNELMTQINIPAPPAGTGSAFIKVARVEADISKITCAVCLQRQGEQVVSCRVALGAVAERPLRLRAAEELLNGAEAAPEVLAQAGQAVRQGIAPLSDVRSTAEYRQEIAAQLFQDTFALAYERAGDNQ